MISHLTKSNPSMGSSSCGDCSLVSEDVIPQGVVAVHRIQDLCFSQYHEVVVPSLDDRHFLGEAETAAVPNIVRPQFGS